MNTATQCLHAIVHGQVQGVNFRYYTLLQAQALHLTGWARNRPDGTVEVIAEGPRAALDDLLDYLRHGPSHASVDRVDVEWREPTGRFAQFQVVR